MTNPTAAIAAPDLPLECVRPGRKRYPIPKPRRAAVYARDGYRCTSCGKSEGDTSEPVTVRLGRGAYVQSYDRTFRVVLTLDHVLPIAAGGCSHEHNLTTMCNQRNSRKGGRP